MIQIIETIYTPYILCPIVAMVIILYVLMVIRSRKEKNVESIPEPEPVQKPAPIEDQIEESGLMSFM